MLNMFLIIVICAVCSHFCLRPVYRRQHPSDSALGLYKRLLSTGCQGFWNKEKISYFVEEITRGPGTILQSTDIGW